MGSQAATSTPVNVLCLDGGGVRGLSSLIILERIMEALQTKHDLPAPPCPCDIFDLICGTSTGGLIALMLGRLRMSVKEAIACYSGFSEDVFGTTVPIPWLKKLKGRAMYDASILEKSIRRMCLEHGGSEDEPLRDSRHDQNGLCRVFVVAVIQSHAGAVPKRFRSYKTGLTMADQCTIWQAARATTAATTFFEPIRFGAPAVTYLDGGLSGANNPSKLARSEIRKIFPGRPIGCFLSVGTGVGKVVSVPRSHTGIAKACARLVTDCQLVAHDVDTEFHNEAQEGSRVNPYFRFSVETGVGTVQLHEWKEIENLTEVTNGYLLSDKQSSKIERCRDRLLDTVKRRREG